MEPSYSLQHHLFNNLGKNIYRDINEFNPLNITHPLQGNHLDPESSSAVGDGDVNSVNLMLSQDCSGFNLGSFFIRRSEWTDRLLDIWWDPVAYEQKHMEWEHKEQDALEQLYTTQPWIRSHTAFIPQRLINSFPTGACSDNGNDTRIHYNQDDRDFVVNMAGCEWGRDCWGEMYNFRELSYYLNRNPWELFKEDLVAVIWFKLTGQKVKCAYILPFSMFILSVGLGTQVMFSRRHHFMEFTFVGYFKPQISFSPGWSYEEAIADYRRYSIGQLLSGPAHILSSMRHLGSSSRVTFMFLFLLDLDVFTSGHNVLTLSPCRPIYPFCIAIGKDTFTSSRLILGWQMYLPWTLHHRPRPFIETILSNSLKTYSSLESGGS